MSGVPRFRQASTVPTKLVKDSNLIPDGGKITTSEFKSWRAGCDSKLPPPTMAHSNDVDARCSYHYHHRGHVPRPWCRIPLWRLWSHEHDQGRRSGAMPPMWVSHPLQDAYKAM